MINLTDLQQHLEELPNQIYEQEKKMLIAKEALEMKKIDYDVSYASALLAANAPNATEKKAQAEIGSQMVRSEQVKCEINFLRENAYLTALNNKFVALRRISGIEERLMGAKISGN